MHTHFIFFIDVQKKQPDNDCAPKAPSSSSNSQEDIFCNETNNSIQTLMSMSDSSPSPGDVGAASLLAQDGKITISSFLFSFLFSLSHSSLKDACLLLFSQPELLSCLTKVLLVGYALWSVWLVILALQVEVMCA